jgi:chromatin remodeling complex protein RSC6
MTNFLSEIQGFSLEKKKNTCISARILSLYMVRDRSIFPSTYSRSLVMAKAKKAASKPAKKSAAKKSGAKPAKKAMKAKKAPKKAAPKKAAPKKAAKAKTKRKPNAAFMKPMTPSSALAAVIGSNPMPRTEVTKRIWDYIKKHKLQDSSNKRMINADDKLKAVFNGKKQVSMFEMTKLVAGQLR